MSERNVCHEAGCYPNPSCCHGEEGNLLVLDVQRKDLRQFPNAKPYEKMVETIASDPDSAHQFIEEPETILDNPSYYRVHIYKDCSHLGEDGNCDLFGKPERPATCSYHQIGGGFCKGCRILDGRPPVDPSFINLEDIT